MRDRLRTRNYEDTLYGAKVQQVPSGVYWLERIVREHGLQAALEIGTGVGALSAYLGCTLPDRVLTCDIADRRPDHIREIQRRLGVAYVRMDAHTELTIGYLMDTIYVITPPGRRYLLIIDGGDKPLEFRLYASRVPRGTVVLVHDNPHEFHADGSVLIDLADDYGLRRICRQQLDSDGTRWAAYLRTDAAADQQSDSEEVAS